jgi:hypothetical protein
VGAYTNDIGTASNQGAAYVFFRSGTTWTQQAQLLASDGLADDLFGIKVSISGDYLIVGAYGDDFSALINRGSAYIFVRSGSTWSQQAKLTSADGNDSDFFGSSVGISGNYAVVGAFNVENGSVSSQGAAYIYMRNGTTWTQQAKVTASDGTENDNFGYSAAISGSNVIIGANSDDIDVAADQGSVYILQRN